MNLFTTDYIKNISLLARSSLVLYIKFSYNTPLHLRHLGGWDVQPSLLLLSLSLHCGELPPLEYRCWDPWYSSCVIFSCSWNSGCSLYRRCTGGFFLHVDRGPPVILDLFRKDGKMNDASTKSRLTDGARNGT